MKTLTLAIGLVIVTSSGMAQAATPEHGKSQHQMTAKQEGMGILKAVNAKAGKVQIAHEPIAALGWPAMTMWFALRDSLPVEIKADAAVRFEMIQDEKKQWVIVRIGRK